MSKVPVVSVVLPVFNGEQHLGTALRSVSEQTYTDFELIAVDDGSSDGSAGLLRKAAGADPRIRIVSQENRGIVPALNAGLQYARGEIIVRMDADDICLPSRLERQVSFLNENPDVVAVGSVPLLVDPDGLPIKEMCQVFSHEEIDTLNLKGSTAICHPTAAIRREALTNVGGYRAEFQWAEDLDLFLRLAEVGRLANMPEVQLLYRQHAGSVGYARAALQRKIMIDAAQAARQRRGLPSLHWDEAENATSPSIADVHRKWAWWALGAGNLWTARKHALQAARLEPFSSRTLRLLACVARGH